MRVGAFTTITSSLLVLVFTIQAMALPMPQDSNAQDKIKDTLARNDGAGQKSLRPDLADAASNIRLVPGPNGLVPAPVPPPPPSADAVLEEGDQEEEHKKIIKIIVGVLVGVFLLVVAVGTCLCYERGSGNLCLLFFPDKRSQDDDDASTVNEDHKENRETIEVDPAVEESQAERNVSLRNDDSEIPAESNVDVVVAAAAVTQAADNASSDSQSNNEQETKENGVSTPNPVTLEEPVNTVQSEKDEVKQKHASLSSTDSFWSREDPEDVVKVEEVPAAEPSSPEILKETEYKGFLRELMLNKSSNK